MQHLTDWNVSITINGDTEHYKFHTEREAQIFAADQKSTCRSWGIEVTVTVKENSYTLL